MKYAEGDREDWVRISGPAVLPAEPSPGKFWEVAAPVSADSPVFVKDGVEEPAVPPAGGEVVAAQTLVALHHPLGPEQQLLFGRHVVRLTVDLDV